MLTMSDQNYIYRYFSIDPGSDTLGLSICEINMFTKRLSIVDTTTTSGLKLSKSRFDDDYIHGNKIARLLAHKEMLSYLLWKWHPQGIICESSYMGKFASAFGVGVETMTYLRQAAYEYNPFMPFELIDPSSAKRNIKATIKGKESTRDCILALVPNEIDYFGHTPLHLLDEHGIDSISISYYKYKKLLEIMR